MRKPKAFIIPEPKLKNIRGRTYFHIVLRFDKDPTTKQPQKPKDIYSAISAKDCKQKALTYLEEHSSKRNGKFSKMELKDFIAKEFFPYEEARTKISRAKGGIVYASYSDRKQRLTDWFVDPNETVLRHCILRRRTISEINPLDIRNYFDALKKSKASAYIIRFLKTDLNQVLGLCLDDLEYPRATLFDGIKSPKISAKEAPLHDIDFLFQQIKNEEKPLMYRALIFCALETMARPSEIFALTWDCLLPDNMLRIDKAMRRSESGYSISFGTKRGDDSNRTIEISSELYSMLKKLQIENGKLNSHIFTTGGVPLNGDNFSKVWRRMKHDLELPKDSPSFYKLKHTANSWLQTQGADRASIKQRMGHSPFSILSETRYLSPTQKAKNGLMQVISLGFSGSKIPGDTPSEGNSKVI